MEIKFDDRPVDTLTIKFWRDFVDDGRPVPAAAPWMCHIGENFIEGVGGSGETPLGALEDLVRNIAREHRHRTDKGVLALKRERQHITRPDQEKE